MKVEINVPDVHVWGALVSAFEGGSNYWYRELEGYGAFTRMSTPDFDEAKWNAWLHMGQLRFKDIEGDGADATYVLTGDLIRKGVAIMHEKCPQQFANLIDDGGDADTGDCLLQCCVLGEVRYG